MLSDSPGDENLTVRLPTDTSARHLEAVHRLVWRDLLDLVPGTMQSLLNQAASQIGLTADDLATGATPGFHGWCGSDLFLRCDECPGDRAVIEIKGPRAAVNLTHGDVFQTDRYRDTYRSDPALICEHLQLPAPILILLDARSRPRKVIEQAESARAGVPLSLADWAVLTYIEVLSNGPFAGHPLAGWLLGS
jgi:hypothetical protein